MSAQPLQLWAGVECTVNRIGDAHYDQLVHSGHDRRLSDLHLIAGLGVRAVRYPVLWERTRDWRWADERLDRLRELGIRPIVGLVHHGSGPHGTSLLDDGFAAGLAGFARRVAERYPWIEDWTPVNEPLTTARFSALYGHWYPHARDDRAFVRALLNQLRAVVLAMRAVRDVVPGARLVQTEDIGKTWSTPELAHQAEYENERRWLTFDLLCGSLDDESVVGRWLTQLGVADAELAWFREHRTPPDVLGINHYLSGERFLDPRLERYPPETHGGNGAERYADVSAPRVLGPGSDGVGPVLLDAWKRYRLPIAVTEAHNGSTREEQLRWLGEVWHAADSARHAGADVRAVTVWSLFGAFGWAELLTAGCEDYEPGVFDVRAPEPRPTALAPMMRALARGRTFDHPVLDGPGWWRRPERLWYPAVGAVARAPRTTRNRSLLITGATGTLGGAFARLAAERGLAHRVTFRDELDLHDLGSIVDALSALRPWAVINCAGYVSVDDAQVEADLCLAVNRDGAAHLAQVCGVLGLPLVTFSTDLVFDGRAGRAYVEDDVVNPLNVYGRSKAEAERSVLETHGDALVVRTSAFFGPWDEYNFVAAAARAIAAGEPFRAADDVVVSPTYVPDLVHATLDLLIDGERGIWHLANAGAVSWAALAQRAAEARELDPRLVEAVPAASLGWIAPRPANSALTSKRAWIMPTLDDALARHAAVSAERQSAARSAAST